MADACRTKSDYFPEEFFVLPGIEKSSATQTENVEENLLQRGSFQPRRKE